MIHIDYSCGSCKVIFNWNDSVVNICRSLSSKRFVPRDLGGPYWETTPEVVEKELLPKLYEYHLQPFFTDSYRNFKEGRKETVDFGLKLPLYKYQVEGANKLYMNDVFGLFDDMGTGKTCQTISVIKKLFEEGKNKFLIITPNSLKKQWQDEFKKFTDIPTTVISGGKKEREKKWVERTPVKIVNYELVRFDYGFFQTNWDMIILDEASRVKNFKALTTRKIKQLKAGKKVTLTGTPIENCILELHSIFEFLNPLILGSYSSFKNQFLITELRSAGGRMFEEVIGHKNLSELKKKIQPYYLRRMKEEVDSELPEVVCENIWVELSEKERQAYNLITDIILSKRNKQQNFIGEIQLLRVLSNGEICLRWSNSANPDVQKLMIKMGSGSSKNDECMELLEQILQSNKKVVVFSEFVNPLIDLKKRLDEKDWKYALLYAGSKKETEIRRFTEDDECKILLSQIRTGGYGLNFQFCNQVIFLNRSWNPAVESQAISRCHRHGQKETVFVYYLIAEDTIEEKVLDTLDKKIEISQKVIGDNILKWIGSGAVNQKDHGILSSLHTSSVTVTPGPIQMRNEE